MAHDINIRNSRVVAKSISKNESQGYGGAGIGSGAARDAEKITIISSKVTAEGGNLSAGIGTGGSDDSTTLYDTAVKAIMISDSSVNAKGGKGGAGIGAGKGAVMDLGDSSSFHYGIVIKDSEVTAYGGDYAAGIGGGSEGNLYRGGGAKDIEITGKSVIQAYGGTSGAGIGGGEFGELHGLRIGGENHSSFPEIQATGGAGAAGIGAGAIGYRADEEVLGINHGKSAYDIEIYGGEITAYGGEDNYKISGSSYSYRGGGAGIGGGNNNGGMKGLKIYGGYIHAVAGSSREENENPLDIGYGGYGSGRGKSGQDSGIKIYDGTIDADTLSNNGCVRIYGGTIKPNITTARGEDLTPLYRTIINAKEYNYNDIKLTNGAGVPYPYSTKDVKLLDGGYFYFYMPKTIEQSTNAGQALRRAEFASGADGNRSYYGEVDDSGKSWLKMDGVVELTNNPEPIAVGDEVIVGVNEENALVSGYKYYFEAVEDGKENVAEVVDGQTFPTEEAVFKANAYGMFRVSAQASTDDADYDGKAPKDELHWAYKGILEYNVTQAKGTILITEDPSKVYDGTPVENPLVTTNSDAVVDYSYYEYGGEDEDGEVVLGSELEAAPIDVGQYIVVASIPQSETYTSSRDEQVFSIRQREITLDIGVVGEAIVSDSSTITIRVSPIGSVDDTAILYVDIKDEADETIFSDLPVGNLTLDESTGIYYGEVQAELNRGKTYTLTGKLDKHRNYYTDEDVVTQYTTGDPRREISVAQKFEVVYGDAPFEIMATTDATGEHDRYVYERIFVDSEYYGGEIAPAISLINDEQQTATALILNAGVAVVKVTLYDDSAEMAYAPVSKYILIEVARKDLTVRSKSHVETIKYGEIESLNDNWSIVYDEAQLANGDTKEDVITFGELFAEAVDKTAQVGEHTINIGRQGEEVSIDGENYKIFLSRNYNLIYELGTVEVTKRELLIKADNIIGEYGVEPSYTYTIEGMVDWDSETSVFAVKPEVALDTTKTEGKAYGELEAGYQGDDVLIVTDQYEQNRENYAISVVPGDLEIRKGNLPIVFEVESKIYDGNPANVILDYPDSYGGEIPEIEYYEITTDGDVKLSEAPKDAGDYYGVVTFRETASYNEASARADYIIAKADPDISIPELTDVYYQVDLQLKTIILPTGWEWVYEDTALGIGVITEDATYTPEDTRNYNVVETSISFEVLPLKDVTILFKEYPAKIYNGEAVKDPEVILNIDLVDGEKVDYTYYE
ncbi:hypothetical protein LJC18_04550, partial [Lachnospiraceae bacterium OttesenSCG-928-E19]|nr:hypothetical protein [Lachnospiraceae bacterium OttesenSCG-928-E19]